MFADTAFMPKADCAAYSTGLQNEVRWLVDAKSEYSRYTELNLFIRSTRLSKSKYDVNVLRIVLMHTSLKIKRVQSMCRACYKRVQ